MCAHVHRRPHVVPITAPSFPMLPRPRVYKTIAYSFIGIVVVVIVAVLWLSSARAMIVVQAKREPVKLDAVIQVAKTPDQTQLSGRVVQGVFRNIQEFQTSALVASSTNETATSTSINATALTPATSTVLIAKGTVRLVNKFSQSQTLVKTTRLLTSDKKLYRIDRTVTIPVGKEISVSVYADQPGEEFAIEPTTFTIPGLSLQLQKYIYAVSDKPFVAVVSKPIPPPPPKTPKIAAKPVASTGPIVTSAAIEEAQKRLYATTFEKAKNTLAADIGDPRFGDVQYSVKVIEQRANVMPGQSAETFLASVALEVTAVYYPKDDMLIFVRQKLKEKIPDGKELLSFGSDAVTFSFVSSEAKTEVASLRVSVDGMYRLTAVSPALQKSLFAGKSKAEALAALKVIPGVENVTITTSPKWYTKIPSLQDHIEIVVQ